MKKRLPALIAGVLAITLLNGCLVFNLEGGKKSSTSNTNQHPAVGQQIVAPTLGQQLMDLQKAKDSGAISDKEYQEQRAKLLGSK